MLPTLAISILPVTVGIEKLAMPIGKGFTLLFEVAKPVQEFTLFFIPITLDRYQFPRCFRALPCP